jgi:transcription initiation factor TFIIF subunit beta
MKGEDVAGPSGVMSGDVKMDEVDEEEEDDEDDDMEEVS